MHDLTLPEIKERIKKLTLPSFDLIIGISTGGIVPASLIAYETGIDMKILSINFRDEENNPRYEQPVLLNNADYNFSGRNLLIIDDVSVTGKTLNLAKSIYMGNNIKTLVFKGKADFVLFPEINTCVNWPWKLRRND